MKRLIYYILLTLVFASCGTKSSHFSIEGRFLSMNQGEFYIYSTDGLIEGVDTIKVNGGRFTYETPCNTKGILIMVFPNFSEHVIFAEPGEKVNINANAANLKEMEVEGTDDNELMTAFRLQTSKMSPPECVRKASQFIKDNADSHVAEYLLNKYFVVSNDYSTLREAEQLAEEIYKAQPQNGNVARLISSIKAMRKSSVGTRIGSFSAIAIDGRKVTNADLKNKYAFIFTWAQWNYDSQTLMRQMKQVKEDSGDKLAVIGINLDASQERCNTTIRRDSLPWPTICDEMSFESPMTRGLGLLTVPDNIFVSPNGDIIGHGLTIDEIKEKLKSILKK